MRRCLCLSLPFKNSPMRCRNHVAVSVSRVQVRKNSPCSKLSSGSSQIILFSVLLHKTARRSKDDARLGNLEESNKQLCKLLMEYFSNTKSTELVDSPTLL